MCPRAWPLISPVGLLSGRWFNTVVILVNTLLWMCVWLCGCEAECCWHRYCAFLAPLHTLTCNTSNTHYHLHDIHIAYYILRKHSQYTQTWHCVNVRCNSAFKTACCCVCFVLLCVCACVCIHCCVDPIYCHDILLYSFFAEWLKDAILHFCNIPLKLWQFSLCSPLNNCSVSETAFMYNIANTFWAFKW